VCQANRGELPFLQGSSGLRKLHNMYLHSWPALFEPQDVQFKLFKTRIEVLKKVRVWSGTLDRRMCKFENTEFMPGHDKSHFEMKIKQHK